MMTLADQVLAHWGMAGAAHDLLAQRENRVYRVTHGGIAYALRLHRPGYRTRSELLSELQWCRHLNAQGMTVPAPVPTTDGTLLAPVNDTFASMLTWAGGTPIGTGTDLPGAPCDLAFRVGREMARLHDITDAWPRPPDFSRPDWTLEALVGDAPLWGRFWRHPDLSPEDVALLNAARAAAREDIALVAHDTGLIHADLLAENLLVDGDRIGLLDFDDSATGYRAFELATFLLRYDQRPDFDALRAALCDGYAIRRRIEAAELDLALLLRALTYPGWIMTRITEPGGSERSRRMVARALRHARTYLERRPS